MEKFIIELKDKSQRSFLLELLAQFDFINFEIKKEETIAEEEYDFFKSAGLFANRNVDADQLRREAWGINN